MSHDLQTLVIQKEGCFSRQTTHSFLQVFLVDPVFLLGIISSDTDSKYLSGFHYPLFAIINPSKGEAYPKLAMQLDLRVFVCQVVCASLLVWCQ